MRTATSTRRDTTPRPAIAILAPISSIDFELLIKECSLDVELIATAHRASLYNQEDIRDASQETMLTIWKAHLRNIPITNLVGLACRVMQHKSLDILRKNHRFSGSASIDAISDRRLSRMEEFEHEDIIASALSRVDVSKREAFKLATATPLTQEEIGKIVGCSAGTISRWVKQVTVLIAAHGHLPGKKSRNRARTSLSERLANKPTGSHTPNHATSLNGAGLAGGHMKPTQTIADTDLDRCADDGNPNDPDHDIPLTYTTDE